jgi:3-methyladenine DNA glycosylase AlkD
VLLHPSVDAVPADADLVRLVRDALGAIGDPARAGPMQAYMKSTMPYRGIPAPVLKTALRPILADHPLADGDVWRATVLALWDDAEFREERYAAIALARKRRDRSPALLDLYEHFIRTGAWWDFVDETAHLVGEVLLAHPEVRPVLEGWAGSDDRWLRRTAIICQVGSKDRLDRDLLTLAIDANLDGSTRVTPALSPYGREFFIRKAIGWALRDHARTDPAWVRRFVAAREDRLSGLSRREALRHLAGRAESRPQP